MTTRMETDVTALADCGRRLQLLCDAPEYGLSSWYEILARLLDEIAEHSGGHLSIRGGPMTEGQLARLDRPAAGIETADL